MNRVVDSPTRVGRLLNAVGWGLFLSYAVCVSHASGQVDTPGQREIAAREITAREITVREIYVPENELERRAALDKNGTILSLAEYRELVDRALSRRSVEKSPLPTLGATLVAASYEGAVASDEAAVSFTAEFQVEVFAPSPVRWVTCDLGQLPKDLAAARLDGEPAWIIDEGGNGQLLFQTDGTTTARTHRLRLEFSETIARSGDLERVTLPAVEIPRRQARVTIPGTVEAKTSSGEPDLSYETLPSGEQTTVVTWWLRDGDPLALEWERPATGSGAPLLVALQAVEAVLRPEIALVHSNLVVEIRRTATRQFSIAVDPRSEVLSLSILSSDGWKPAEWRRDQPGRVDVELAESVLGRVGLRLLLQVPVVEATIPLVLPSVDGALANRGTLDLLDSGYRLDFQATRALEERPSVGRQPTQSSPALDRFRVGGVQASFAFRTAAPSITVAILETATDWDWKTSSRVRLGARDVWWESLWRLDVRGQRVHELRLPVPEGWELVGLVERPTEAGSVDLSVDRSDEREVRLMFGRAVQDGLPLQLRLLFRWSSPPQDLDEPRSVALALPAPSSLDHAQHVIGVSRVDSWELRATDLTGWTALSRKDSRRLGLTDQLTGNETWIGGFWTELERPTLSLEFAPRAPRGEAQIVTSLLTTERRPSADSEQRLARVRSEIQLAVVDHELESLSLDLPGIDAETEVEIRSVGQLPAGIREVRRDGSRRTVVFEVPWRGTRRFVVEYDRAERPGADAALPDVILEGRFGGERFWMVASEGSVEVTANPGPALAAFDPSRIPAFAQGFTEGRVVAAYRRARLGDLGTWSATVFDRAPVLSRFARELRLRTQIDVDGRARTEASTVLAYDRAQSLTIELPAGSQLVGVALDGEPMGRVRPGVSEASDRVSFMIPLPARSFVHVSWVYDQGDEDHPWPAWGTRRESGPRLVDVPVGRVVWELYVEEGTAVRIAGGNLQRLDEERSGFWEDIVVPLTQGRWPAYCVLPDEPSPMPILPPLSEGERAGARTIADSRVLASERSRARPGPSAPRVRLLPVGTPLVFTKFAGDAELVVHVESRDVALGSRRGLFVLAFLALILVAVRRRPALTLGLSIAIGSASLFLATLPSLPTLAPLRAVTEACFVFVVFVWPIWGLVSLLARSRVGRRLGATVSPARALFLLGIIGGVLSSAPGIARAQATPEVFDPPGVVIGVPEGYWSSSPVGLFRVFVPRQEFVKLWRDAYPNDPAPGVGESRVAPIERLVWGPADYSLELTENRYRLQGRVSFLTLGDGPWTLTIPRAARVLELELDGKAVSSIHEGGGTRLRVIEPGLHQLDLVLTGPVVESGARGSLSLALVAGSSTRLVAVLPDQARLDLPTDERRGLSSFESGRAVFDLGQRNVLDLAWRLPASAGVVDAREESVSLTGLSLSPGALEIRRTEIIDFIGQPRERVEYRIDGAWEVTSVEGAVSSWRVSESDGKRTLAIAFREPTGQALLAIQGVARLAGETDLALPTLTLVNGRQESFVGLIAPSADREGWRFAASALDGLRRASTRELAPRFAVPELGSGGRLHATYGSGTDSRVRLERSEAQLNLVQEAVYWRGWERATATVRLRAVRAERASLRYRIGIPPGWRVAEVASEAVENWRVEAASEGSELLLDLDRDWSTELAIDVSLDRALTSPRETVTLPTLSWLDAPTGQGWTRATWLVTADSEIEVEAPSSRDGWDLLGADTVIQDRETVAGATRRFALVWENRSPVAPTVPGALSVAVRVRPARVNATVVSAARLDVDELLVNARVEFDIRFSPRERLELLLPATAEVTRVDGLNLRRKTIREDAGGVRVAIELESPLRGRIDLDVAYRVPRAGGGSMRMTPIGVSTDGETHAVDHFLVVWQPSHGELDVVSQDGLAPVEARLLPAVPTGIGGQRWFATLRSTRPDWHFEWQERVLEIATDLAAVIPLAELETILGRDGTVRTRVTYTLINRSLQFLEVVLPTGSELWGVTVDGRNVPVGRESGERGDALRIPVARAGQIGLPREIRITFQELALQERGDSLDFTAPRVRAKTPVEVLETVWEVHVPRDRSLRETGERMRVVPRTHKPSQKLRALLENRDALLRAAKEATGVKLRARARQELARLDQALSDQLAELENASESLPAQDVDSANDQTRTRELLEAGREARREVRAQLGSEDASASGAETALFQDRVRFRKAAAWTERAGRPSDGAPEGALPLRVPAWTREALRPLEGSEIEAEGVDGATAATASSAEGSVTGVDLSLDPVGYTTITYHRADGDATLEFVLASAWSTETRFALLVALAASGLLIFAHVLGRRRRT